MKISQGVCTELVAQDGLGCAPVREASKQRIAELVAGLVGEVDEWSWSSVGEYLDQIDRAAAVNLAALAPHATIRSDYLGGEDRPATEQELDAMSRAVDDAMRDGAFGLSTGLEYEPTTAASTAELIRLAAAARRHGGIYITHLRDYDLHFRAALAEAVEICRSASIPLHYSHFHCYGRRNFGLGAEICQGAERATNQAAGVSFDIYPYTTGTTYAHWFLSRDSQRRTIPALKEAMRSREGRAGLIDALDREGMPVDIGWEDCYPGAGGELIDARGKSLAELSVERSEHPAELLMQLVERSNFTATMNCVMTHADDVDGTIHHPLATVGSDAILHGGGVHPRGWGSFAKVIRLYVEERRSMTIEQAVALMSGRPARRLGLRDRGVIRPGAVADLAVFDPASVRDEATYAHPTKVARGFDLVFVGGRPVWRDGAATGETPGRALRSSAGRGGGAARASVQGPGRTHPDWARWVRGARRGDSRRDRGS
jgi:N-acyl-D-amino-acid deacylase